MSAARFGHHRRDNCSHMASAVISSGEDVRDNYVRWCHCCLRLVKIAIDLDPEIRIWGKPKKLNGRQS